MVHMLAVRLSVTVQADPYPEEFTVFSIKAGIVLHSLNPSVSIDAPSAEKKKLCGWPYAANSASWDI